MPEVIFEEVRKGIGVLTLAEPAALNAMDEAMALVFQKKVQELKGESLRALILTGAGRAFSAGGNLEMLEAKTKLSSEENKARMLDFYDKFLCVRDLDIPLIAAVNGHAIGAGLCLALACDIRVISDTAQLGMTFTRLGLHPGMGGTFFLKKVVGEAAALELLLTGRIVQGKDVIDFGLARECCPADVVVKRAVSIATEIVGCGPLATKQLLNTLRGNKEELKVALLREAECQSENYASDQFIEGIRAVQEKRPPQFD